MVAEARRSASARDVAVMFVLATCWRVDGAPGMAAVFRRRRIGRFWVVDGYNSNERGESIKRRLECLSCEKGKILNKHREDWYSRKSKSFEKQPEDSKRRRLGF